MNPNIFAPNNSVPKLMSPWDNQNTTIPGLEPWAKYDQAPSDFGKPMGGSNFGQQPPPGGEFGRPPSSKFGQPPGGNFGRNPSPGPFGQPPPSLPFEQQSPNHFNESHHSFDEPPVSPPGMSPPRGVSPPGMSPPRGGLAMSPLRGPSPMMESSPLVRNNDAQPTISFAQDLFPQPPTKIPEPVPAPMEQQDLFPQPPVKVTEPVLLPVPSPVPAPVPDPSSAKVAESSEKVPAPVPAPAEYTPTPLYTPTPIVKEKKGGLFDKIKEPELGKALPRVASLSLSNLKKVEKNHLPPALSSEDRVVNALNKNTIEINLEWQKARDARKEQADKKADGDELYTPPGLSDDDDDIAEGSKTPVYGGQNIAGEQQPQSTPVKDASVPGLEFSIDPTKSFFDMSAKPTKESIKSPEKSVKTPQRPAEPAKQFGLKIRSMASLQEVKKEAIEDLPTLPPVPTPAPAFASPRPPSKARPETETRKKKPKVSMFDKVIMALKKRQQVAAGPQMQLPSMNMVEDDTPPLPPGGYGYPAPPLPPGSGYEPPPPLPNDPKTYDDSFLDDESEVNDLVLSIVQDLDKNITEEEKLRVAQEKLAKILQKKAQQRAAQQHKMGPRSRMAEPPEPAYRAGPRSRLQTLNPSMNFEQAPPLPPTPAETPAAAYRPGPRSRMENPPEPAYRAGPRSRLQILNPTLLTNPPPPPPPPEPGVSGGPPSQKNQNITEDDI